MKCDTNDMRPPAIQPSPGAWSSHPLRSVSNGAIIIEDGAGEIIGWATDCAGKTTEDGPPDRRDPRQIAMNAMLFQLAPEMRTVLDLLCQPGAICMGRVLQARDKAHVILRLLDDQARTAWSWDAFHIEIPPVVHGSAL
jgi:hypothetical protein